MSLRILLLWKPDILIFVHEVLSQEPVTGHVTSDLLYR